MTVLPSFTDIARESFREKPFVNTKCTSYTQFVFQWSSAIQSLNVRNSTLHAYIQTIDRNFNSDEPVSVTLTVTMIPRRENGTSNPSDLSDGVVASQEVVNISRVSDGWMELNVTKGVENILPQMQIENYADIQVIIKAEVNCNNQKVPFNLINPAEIPLEQEERQLNNQPFLVVFGDNEETKEALRKQKEEEVVEGEMQVYDGPLKRSTSTHSHSSCQISSYILDFHEFGLTHVIQPRSIDISKCSGICNGEHVINRLGTNHAKMMANSYNQQMLSEEPVTATVPCCVPTKYETVVLLVRDNSALFITCLSSLKATECRCR